MNAADELKSLKSLFSQKQHFDLNHTSLILPKVPHVELAYKPLANLIRLLHNQKFSVDTTPVRLVNDGGRRRYDHRIPGHVELSIFTYDAPEHFGEFDTLAGTAIRVLKNHGGEIPRNFYGLDTGAHRWSDYVHTLAEGRKGLFGHAGAGANDEEVGAPFIELWEDISSEDSPPLGYRICAMGQIPHAYWGANDPAELQATIAQIASGSHRVRVFPYNIFNASMMAIDMLIEGEQATKAKGNRRGRPPKQEAELVRTEFLSYVAQHPTMLDHPAELAEKFGVTLKTIKGWIEAERKRHYDFVRSQPKDDEDE